MGFFTTNWRTQVSNLLPPVMRSQSMTDYCTALLKGLQTDTDNNLAFDIDIRNRALFNGQKIVLQAALNYLFSTTGIIVETQTALATSNFIYNESEGLAIYSYNETESSTTIYTFNESEAVDAFDFLIKVPVGFYTTEIGRQITAQVKIFKLAGKSFSVITY